MLPVVKVPEIVSRYAPYFEDVFTAGEYNHFQKYLTGLLLSENKTITSINSLCVLDLKNQSSLNRFLTDSKYEIFDLQSRRLNFLNQSEDCKFKTGKHNGVLMLDDTLLEHYGKDFDKIALLYDRSSDSYVWAHNLVNLHYSDNKVDYPVLFDLWEPMDLELVESALRSSGIKIKTAKEAHKVDAPKKWKNYLTHLQKSHKKDCPKVQEAYRTKIEIGMNLLKDFFSLYPHLDLPICFDRWFTCDQLCSFINKDLGKAYVGAIKSDEEIVLKGSIKQQVGSFAEELKEEYLKMKAQKPGNNRKSTFKQITIEYKGNQKLNYYCYGKVHRIAGYGRVKLIIYHHKADLSDQPTILICNRKYWRDHSIVRIYRHRWPVEEYHKEGKAEGLNQYQLRNFEGIKKHIALVALVYSMLQFARYDHNFLNSLQSQLKTDIEGSIAYWRKVTAAQSFFLLIEWIQMRIMNGKSVQEIMDKLLPAFGIT